MNFLSVLRGGPGNGKALLKNTSWLFIGEIVGRLIRFWIVVYAARVMGASEYGVFSYALTIAAFATILADIGISALLTRETSKDPESSGKYFNALFATKLILIAIVGVSIYLILPILSGVSGLNPLIPLILAMFAFDSLREFGFGVLRGMEKMEKEAVTKILMNLLITGFGFWALYVEQTAYSLSLGYVLGAGIGCLLTFLLLKDFFLRIKEGLDISLVWPLIKMAWPIGILQLLGAIMVNTDMLMLGWWRSPEELGYYGAAQKIILLLYVAPSLVASAAFPLFSRLALQAKEQFREVFEKTVCASQLLAFPLAVGGIILAKDLMILLFGQEYASGSVTLALLLSTLIIVFPSTLFSNALFAYNKQKLFTKFVLLGVGLNFAFNYLLIPRFGIEGAAAATIISQLLANLFIWREMYITNSFMILPKLKRILVAGVIMGIFCSILTQFDIPVLLNVAIGIAVYLAALIALKEPIFKEIRKIIIR